MIAEARAGDEMKIRLVRSVCASMAMKMPVDRLLEQAEFMLELARRTDLDNIAEN